MWYIMVLVYTIIGGLIVSRQPHQILGWLLMLLPFQSAYSGLSNYFLMDKIIQTDVPSTLVLIYAWFSSWDWWLVMGPIFLILQLFPTGKIISKSWRWAVILLVITFSYFIIIGSMFPIFEINDTGKTFVNPIGILPEDSQDLFLGVFAVLLIFTAFSSVLTVIFRYYKGSLRERSQIKWLLYACVIFLIIYITSFIQNALIPTSNWFSLLSTFSIMGIAIAIGVAILRYKIWDIDFVINRSLIYGLLTTILAGIFAATVSVFTQITKSAFGAEGNVIAAALAAVFVAGLFQPLRTRLEKVMNHWLLPENIDLTEGLMEINPILWQYFSTQQILQASLKHLEDIYSFSSAAIYILGAGGKYYPEVTLNLAIDSLEPIIPSQKQMELFKQKKGHITENDPLFSVIIPVYISRRKTPQLLGILCLGKRAKDKGFSTNDLRTLSGFGEKLGLPLFALKEIKN